MPMLRSCFVAVTLALSVTAQASEQASSQVSSPTTSATNGEPTSLVVRVTVPGQSAPGHIIPALGAETGSTIPRSSFGLFQSPGGTNLYSLVSASPSVMSQTTDPYGLAAGGPVGISIRGETSIKGAIGNVEGVPITTIDPGAGQQFLFDSENLSSVTLLTPPFAPEHISVFTVDGYLNRNIRWSANDFGAQISQSIGTFGYHKTFARLDSGLLPSGTKFFVSGSYAHANSWRGYGASPDYRYNASIGISQKLGESLSAKLFAVYDDMKGATYLPLSYAQATNLVQNYYLGYNNNPQSSAYYGYNQQNFQDYALIGEVLWQPNEHTKLVVKPFYNQENGYIQGNTGIPGIKPGQVGYWSINHHSYGVLSKLDFRYANTDFTLGYWYQNIQPPGPPTSIKAYNVGANGLQFSNWTPLLVRPDANNVFNSPFIQAKHSFGSLTLTAGLRYLIEQIPTLSVYNGKGVGDVSTDQAITQAAYRYTIYGHTNYQLLPYLGAVYKLSPHLSVNAAYGRGNGGPALEMWPNLVLSGMSPAAAQSAWDSNRPGTSDAFSLGMAIVHSRWYLRPNLFYTTYGYKDVPIAAPGGLIYNQNLGTGRAWGLELQGQAELLDNLVSFGSFSYNKAYFTQNIPYGGSILPTRNLQFPNVPLVLTTLGLSYRYHDFTISPVVQYTGTRYADSLHTQVVPAYWVTNLNLGYQRPIPQLGLLQLDLRFLNLFDRRYIGLVSQNYVQTGASAASFYPGAPFTVVGTIGLRF